MCADKEVKRHCTILESLEESLKEMKLMREGKIPQQTWREFMEPNKDKIKQTCESNPIITKDDEWRDETEWDEIFQDTQKFEKEYIQAEKEDVIKLLKESNDKHSELFKKLAE